MNNLSISIDAKTFSQWLGKRPENMERAIRNVVRKAALLGERYAKILTPVDTGRLRSSISTNIDNISATVRPHTNYAIFVHEGTRHMSPRPFMREARLHVYAELDRILEAEVENALK